MNADPRTELGRGRGALAATLLFGTVVAVAVVDWREGMWPDIAQAGSVTAGDLVDGSAPRRIDARLETHAPSMRALRPHWNEAAYTLFRKTPDMVVAGRADWLYYKGSLTPCVEPEASQRREDMIRSLTVFRDAAAGVGTRLVVLVVPAKWRVHPEGLRGAVPPGRRAVYRRALDGLRAENFDAPDVLEALADWTEQEPDRPVFARNDTHLTLHGFSRLATDLIAPLAGVSVDAARGALSTRPRVERVFPGDLPGLMSIRPESGLGRRLSRHERYHEPGSGADRPDCPIVVFGDSFTEQHDKILPRLVEAACGRPVDARFTGFGREFGQLPVEYSSVPELLLMVLSERRFGP